MEAVTGVVGQRLSPPSRRLLERPFVADKVCRALFEMTPSKAPGLDGFNAGFFQKFWPTVGKNVTDTCLSILNDRGSMRDLNHTLIVLILKVDRAVKLGDFRPISLCNVSLKIAACTRPPQAPILHRSTVSWSFPPTGSFKLNIDANIAVNTGVNGLGLVIRDHFGRVRAVSSVHSDALYVINVLKEGAIPYSDLGLIVSDILQLCFSFDISAFCFVPRVANKVADVLAKAAISFGSSCFWFDFCPPFVELLVQDDAPG
ncbi:hypothetical protein ACOSP7_019297 [Xanthoceras sorbifolium]